MVLVAIALGLFALVGHAALWVGLTNRIHSTGAPHWMVRLLSGGCHLLLIAIPIAVLWSWWISEKSLGDWLLEAGGNWTLWAYLVPCWILAAATVVLWRQRRWSTSCPLTVSANHTVVVDVAARLGQKPVHGLRARAFSHLPGNQVLQIGVHDKQLQLERLPAELDGLSIAHLTDLHFLGHIGIEFFHEVIEQTNALRPDMIVVTGDIVDELARLDWIPQTLGRLSAPLGIYFVLGNHDLFTGDPLRVRKALADSGLIDLGGRWKRIEVAGAEVILAGNELPWFAPAADMEHCPPRTAGQFRILLSHSPDQFGWARRWDFDLMLAGHAHGGQICLPVIGPIFCPSWYGVKYACGTFYARPTVMHVSRGISSEVPLRLNCRPELAKLVLRSQGTA